MYYENTNVLNFGKYAGVRVKWIRTINGRTVYAYDVGKIKDLRSVLDTYMIILINQGWRADFVYPVSVLERDNESFTVRYYKNIGELQFLIGAEK